MHTDFEVCQEEQIVKTIDPDWQPFVDQLNNSLNKE